MDTFFAIFDNANSTLQWYGRAKDEDATWKEFREDLGRLRLLCWTTPTREN